MVLSVKSRLVKVMNPVLVEFIVTPPLREIAELDKLPVLNTTRPLSTLAVFVGALEVILFVP